ncbi:aldo/keto reductase family protein [Aspergillus ibericus CBS 121593]|uniref:Aldo/keto reductase n=1 Tax=Aspergillus ibericus CBS 121593 TaxID=1448316 RepID=A0A395GPE7_9EURO|nr:aldo/keto reductase [Aspergillus ibericus CBS 121593]RAK96828.1 aldo/keto reductase [Aspergillus ibericus CBS 121593]
MTPTIANRSVGPIGFGLMGLTWRPQPSSYDDAVKVMKRALDLGANLWNGGEMYGPPNANSLHLLEYYFTQYPEDSDKVIISIKGAAGAHGPDGSPENVRASVENGLKILDGKAFISIFEPARIDPNTPIETTISILSEYVKAGKIGGIGLTECNEQTLRRAHAIHPITAVEVELSLFSTNPLHNGVAEACAELGIALVAYSPLSRGWLTGQVRSLDDLPADDIRRLFPRFQPEVFHLNLRLVEGLEQIAAEKKVTLAQTALAWVRAQSRASGAPLIIPIPGCTTVARVEENLASVELTAEEVERIAVILEEIPVHGKRYPEMWEQYNDL